MSTMNSPTRERFPPSSSRRSSVGQPFRLNSVRPKPLIIPSYASSIPSVALPGVQSSVPSPRYPSFSAAGSNAGSNHFNALLLSTTGSHSSSSSLTSNVTARFKRAQVRIKSITKESPAVNALNPDKLDLLELEDPDQVFRLFNVRDVRGIEERAKTAADAKVTELRTMVGERYRDLLSAADSIIRMKVASDKMVDRLESVDHDLLVPDVDQSPHVRVRTTSRQILTPTVPTFDSPATLSLTIQVLLSIPSSVHSLLESSSFLAAARIEGVGRIIYRELSSFESESDDERTLKERFPIIERQWESISTLGAVIVRRATAELKAWDVKPLTIAQTLASIVMLENISLPSSLHLLLESRSKSVSSLFDSTPSTNTVEKVLHRLTEAIDIVLHTTAAASTIFTSGLLLQILQEIESPSSSTASPESLQPILSTLPNYPLLSRHLPSSILDFSPFLSITSERNRLSEEEAHREIEEWTQGTTERVVRGVEEWITDLKGGARSLTRIRQAVRDRLSSSSSSGVAAVTMRERLEAAIEQRLETVYQLHFTNLVARVPELIGGLVTELGESKADIDPGWFLFEMSLSFPPISTTSSAVAVAPSPKLRDPYNSFVEKVTKRVSGRSPLIDRGVSELEASARELKQDLDGWLSHGESDKARLRDRYLQSVKATLDGIHSALSSEVENATQDVDRSLFVGNFLFILESSDTFVQDLLLNSSSATLALEEADLIQNWSSRLTLLQSRSLLSWRSTTLDSAIACVELLSLPTKSLTTDVISPSTSLLDALRLLVTATQKLGPQRTRKDPKIVQSLMSEFLDKSLAVYRGRVGSSTGVSLRQTVWDIELLRRLSEKEEEWIELSKSFKYDPIEIETVSTAVQAYLQRTQSIYSSILPPSTFVSPTLSTPTTKRSKLLRLGVPIASTKAMNVGMAQSGMRLGLLATR